MANTKTGNVIEKVFTGLLIALVIIQFIRPPKNINNEITAQDINVMHPMPDSVHKILAKACYDCHSNNTRYPWYNNIQPVAWWLEHHVNDGKRSLNFSEFGNLPIAKQAKKLKKVASEVQKGGMPLDSYTWIHKDAILTDAEKMLVIDWANNLSQQIGGNVQ